MPPSTPVLGLLLYCRPGFERELLAEAHALCGAAGLAGQAQPEDGAGFLDYRFYDSPPLDFVAEALPWRRFVFARQRVFLLDVLQALPTDDRAAPLVAAAVATGLRYGRLWCETADTNEAKQLAALLKRLGPHIERGLIAAGALAAREDRPTLHLFFTEGTRALLGTSWPGDASDWPLGIVRLRMPREAPSRSTLKLAEAFLELLNDEERKATLRAGLRAVDLGAAPGGWSWQLAQRGLLVTAIDNGPMNRALLADGMVEHVRADGFVWRPPRPVEWMVCDMVDQPARVAQLAADWIAAGRCKRSIFNLKLPMKKRFEEVQRCRSVIARRLADRPHTLRLRQLYHDREEVTAYLA